MKWKGKDGKGVTRCKIAYSGCSGAPLGLAWLGLAWLGRVNVKAKMAR